MENELTCIIDGIKTDVAKFFETAMAGPDKKLEAVKLLREISSSDLAAALAVVSAISKAGEMPAEISFFARGTAELKFKNGDTVIADGNKSGGCGGAAAAVFILAALPFFIR